MMLAMFASKNREEPKQQSDLPDSISSPYAVWVRDSLEVAYEQVHRYSGQVVQRQKRLYDRRAVRLLFAVGDWVLHYYTPAKKCKLDSAWVGPYLVVSLTGWALGIQRDPNSPIIMVHCQDLKKIPQPQGAVSWLATKKMPNSPSVLMLGASTMQHTSQVSPSITVSPPLEEVTIADVDSVESLVLSAAPDVATDRDVTSARP